MEHPLHLFGYCPRCGSNTFVINDIKSKRCGECGFVLYFNAIAATVALIMNKRGELLVARRSKEPAKGTLDLPGGFADSMETAEEGVAREVLEETGIRMEIDRLGFVHENYFLGDSPAKLGKLIYEISFFFYMKVPDDFAPTGESFTEDDHKEFLRWVSPDEDVKMYPMFFKTELLNPADTVKHFVTDNRKKQNLN